MLAVTTAPETSSLRCVTIVLMDWWHQHYQAKENTCVETLWIVVLKHNGCNYGLGLANKGFYTMVNLGCTANK
jgi:hypothetical protein